MSAYLELCDWCARHHVNMTTTVDEIRGEPIVGKDGRLYENVSPGETLHVRIDLPRQEAVA